MLRMPAAFAPSSAAKIFSSGMFVLRQQRRQYNRNSKKLVHRQLDLVV